MEGWLRDGMDARLTLTLSPTLCAMLRDPLLQERYVRHLERADRTGGKGNPSHALGPRLPRTGVDVSPPFAAVRDTYAAYGRNLVGAFRRFQEQGDLEIATCAATHALLPLLADHPPSLRAQMLVARDHYRNCFGREPQGIWLPECAYVEGMEPVLQEANIRWFVTDTHGDSHARPRPRYGVLCPDLHPQRRRRLWPRSRFRPAGLEQAATAIPGDPRYRDFYRDIGFDLDFDYVKPYLPAPDQRGFTGIKYYRITGRRAEKAGL